MKPYLAFSLVLAGWLAQGASAQVTFDRILAAGKEPQNWLTYSGSTFSQRYSTLDQITPANVKNLELQWIFQARSLEKFEATAAGGGRRDVYGRRRRMTSWRWTR